MMYWFKLSWIGQVELYINNIAYVEYITAGRLPQNNKYTSVDLAWLEDRKKLRKDWYNYLKAAEEKVKTLLKDREWAINYPAVHDYLAINEQSKPYLIEASTTMMSIRLLNFSLRLI